MSGSEGEDRCEFCKQGKMVKRDEQLSFHQATSRVYVSCRVAIPMRTCDRCGARSWDEAAEAIIERAVRQEYDKLS